MNDYDDYNDQWLEEDKPTYAIGFLFMALLLFAVSAIERLTGKEKV